MLEGRRADPHPWPGPCYCIPGPCFCLLCIRVSLQTLRPAGRSHLPESRRTSTAQPDLGLFLSLSFSFSVSWPRGFLETKAYYSPTPLKSQRRGKRGTHPAKVSPQSVTGGVPESPLIPE